MKRLSFFIICMVFLAITFGACGPSQDEQNATATARIATSDALKQSFALTPVATPEPASIPTFKVIKSTGLYSAFDVDADMIAELSVGTIVVPADNKKTFFCDSFIDAGMNFILCKVKVFGTGQTGWVLKKWVEEN